MAMIRSVAMGLLAASLGGRAAVISEDFAAEPAQHGWRVFGDASLFHWNATNENLEVTWDSSHANTFFYRPLGTVLTKSDDFSFSFDLRLSDIRAGSNPNKPHEFEIAIGLLNYRNATNPLAFRGTGVSSTYGVRNVVEFDYFPDAGFGDTVVTTVISTNNGFAYYNNFLTLRMDKVYRVTMSYSASNQVIHTFTTENGLPFGAMGDVMLGSKLDFDFRVDSFAVISYSDAIQAPPSTYNGSVLAHGVVDNVELVVPPQPLANLHLKHTNSVWMAEFLTLTNWVYTLEGCSNFSAWTAMSSPTNGNGATVRLTDTDGLPTKRFYRVRAERP